MLHDGTPEPADDVAELVVASHPFGPYTALDGQEKTDVPVARGVHVEVADYRNAVVSFSFRAVL